ncbi:hypothetical protein GCK72_014312 [Caenorhabditis remanei]|uniref:Serpentine receptor class gamma n=1 Tax=Caenorhabditis remanei TaxID=31234 RepID=A0A6A5GTP9_CAERE|nr:hypothetical protein GCK72_014312 [Caenorhabditis remanei]KAF1757855.1 hypothetical protein GCK72_014312 [Caenorhabditis remanei]
MFTAEGFCVQARSPFPFGSVVIAFQGSLFQLRNNYFLLFNNLFWMSSCLINNSILLVKLVQLKMSLSFQARSQKSYKAEVSLTFTTFSMIFSYLSNSMIVIAAQLGGELSYYAIMLRPFGNDLETCVVPWINGKLMKAAIPIISIYPLFFTFFMFPAVGYCTQPLYPFTFGAITFHFDGTWFGASHKAEISLTVTSLSMTFSYVTNGMIALGNFILPNLTFYFIALRPVMNDLDTCLVPWLCAKIVKYSTPIIFVYPFLFTFTLIPALGFCRQLLGPYQFGAIYIFFSGNFSWFNSLGFFFSDLIVIRAPSTGIMTSWCYRQEPNRFLNIVFQAQAYFNYCTMFYPVLFSVVRLVITYVPNRHDEVNAKILKFAIPAIQIYPILLLLHMIPALGVCRQHSSPYSFGAVYVHFINSWRGIMNAPITVINSAVWLTTCLILNFILYRKLRKLKTVSLSQTQTHQNIRNRIIEVSLSLTTLAMLFAYATNLVFLGSFMIDYDIATYLVVFRPFGYDLELCVVPWCLSFFLSDYIIIRLPSTGIMTKWCYQQSPNRFLSLIFTSHIYFSYPLMIYPILLTVVRFMPIHYPHKHRELNTKILCYSIPIIHLYSFPFIFFMFPALGVCRQFMKPYPFGSAFIHFYGSWHGIMNMPFQILNTCFWLVLYLGSNFCLHRELRNLKLTSQCHLHANQSAKYRRAEFSLTVTTVSMILAYVVNIVFQVTFLVDYRLGTYFSLLRPYGNDLETCVLPWIFYLTHPAFRSKQGSITSSSGQQRTTIT